MIAYPEFLNWTCKDFASFHYLLPTTVKVVLKEWLDTRNRHYFCEDDDQKELPLRTQAQIRSRSLVGLLRPNRVYWHGTHFRGFDKNGNLFEKKMFMFTSILKYLNINSVGNWIMWADSDYGSRESFYWMLGPRKMTNLHLRGTKYTERRHCAVKKTK
jgi:hypothetical protein